MSYLGLFPVNMLSKQKISEKKEPNPSVLEEHDRTNICICHEEFDILGA